jgi:hypothetical protein
LLGTTLVFAGTSVWLAKELGETRDALAAAEAAGASQVARQQETERAPLPGGAPFMDEGLPPPSSEPRAEPADAAPPIDAPRPPPRPDNAARPRGRDVAASPAEARQRRIMQETRLRDRFGDMPRDLGLDTATADKLFDLLADSMTASMDQARAYSGDPAGQEAVIAAARRERDAAIDALLGPDKAAEFQSFEKSMPARMQVGRIAADMTASDVPLREDQRKQLVGVIAKVQEQFPAPVREEGGDNVAHQVKYLDWQAEYSKRVQAGIEPLLTAEQRARYREAVELQNSRRAATRARAAERTRNTGR